MNNKKSKEDQDFSCCAHRLLWVYLIGQETNKKHKRKELTWFKLQCFCKFDIRLSSWTKYYSLEVKRHEFKVYPNRAVLETILKSTCWTYQQLPPEQTHESLVYYRDGFLRPLLGNAKSALVWLWLPAAFFFFFFWFITSRPAFSERSAGLSKSGQHISKCICSIILKII